MQGKALCEFQGAALCSSDESEMDAVANLAARLRAQGVKYAPRIPVLPRHVHEGDMFGEDLTRLDVPVGYSKSNVGPAWFPLTKSPCMMVLGDDREALDAYSAAMNVYLSQAYGMEFRVLDPNASLGSVDNMNVCQTAEELAILVDELTSSDAPAPKLVLCTSIVHLMTALDAERARKIQAYFESEQFVGKTNLIVVSETWRVRALYDKWFKVLSAQGNGVWVGNGFADQSIIKPVQMKPAYRLPIRKDEGYVVMFGACDSVRLLTSNVEDE